MNGIQTTDEIPDETYDSLLKIFEECIENDLGLMLRDGLYTELAEWYGCEGAERAITEWMVDAYIDEAREDVTVERDGESLRVYTRNFCAIHDIDRAHDGVYWSGGTLHHREDLWDRHEIPADELPNHNAERQAEKIIGSIEDATRSRHPSLTAAERNAGSRWI